MSVTAKPTNPYQDRVQIAKSLFGILPEHADMDEAKRERTVTRSDHHTLICSLLGRQVK